MFPKFHLIQYNGDLILITQRNEWQTIREALVETKNKGRYPDECLTIADLDEDITILMSMQEYPEYIDKNYIDK